MGKYSDIQKSRTARLRRTVLNSFFGISIVDEGFDILLDCRDCPDVELILKHFQDIRGEKGREGRTGVDILDSEVKEGEQDDDSLLLIPCDIENDRKIVDAVDFKGILRARAMRTSE